MAAREIPSVVISSLDRRRLSLVVRGFLYAAISTGLIGCWQFATVNYNYSGNWTALFRTTEGRPQPPQIAEKLYTFSPGSSFDGQFYHYIAHDPLFRRGMARYVDLPRLRYGRILVPALAYLSAMGQDRGIDIAYFAMLLLSVFIGTYWLCELAGELNVHPAWGMCFALIPSVIMSANLATIDAPLTALCVGFALHLRRNTTLALYAILALAPLVRESGMLLIIGYLIALAVRRDYFRAAIASSAAIPCIAWSIFVMYNTRPDRLLRVHPVPFLSVLQAFAAHEYQSGVTHAIHIVALISLWSCFPLSIFLARQRRWQPTTVVAVLFSGLGAVVLSTPDWHRVNDFARVFSPLLLLIAIEGVAVRWWWTVLPLALSAFATSLLLGEQVLGIFRRLITGT